MTTLKYAFFLLFLFSINLIYAQNNKGVFEVKNIDKNSSNSDFGASFYGKNKIIFSSSRDDRNKKKWDNGQGFLDLYEATISENETAHLTNVDKLTSRINSKFHESNVAFSNDGKTVYFTRNNRMHTKSVVAINKEPSRSKKTKYKLVDTINLALYKADINANGEWVNIQLLPFNKPGFSTGHPTLSKDGKKMYFVTDRPDSLGKTDIYVTNILEDGTYSFPINLGDKINTLGNEMFPFISNDILYFASDGRADTIGGLDIYAVRLFENEMTSEILHLGAPINSIADDFSFISRIVDRMEDGFFTSNRLGGKGDDDIYHFKTLEPIILDCNRKVYGIVSNNLRMPIANVQITLFNEKNEILKKITTKNNGLYSFVISCDKNYKLQVKKEGFKTLHKSFNAQRPKDKLNYNFILQELITEPIVDVVTIPEIIQQEVVLPQEVVNTYPNEVVFDNNRVLININTIYFDFNKSNIRLDAKIELDKVIEIMNKYPGMIIAGSSHTDSRGNDSKNLSLSNRRAIATLSYLVKGGVDSKRISVIGFGEAKLVNSCYNNVKCTKEEHQKNRRTEFVIINPEVLN